jgi:hypothetical protein
MMEFTGRPVSTLWIAGLALAGVLVRAADSPDLLFGLGTDFISGFLFGAAIMLAARAIFRSSPSA